MYYQCINIHVYKGWHDSTFNEYNVGSMWKNNSVTVRSMWKKNSVTVIIITNGDTIFFYLGDTIVFSTLTLHFIHWMSSACGWHLVYPRSLQVVFVFKFLLIIHSKPCLVQLPRPYSFQKMAWPPLDYLLWRRSGRFFQEFARVENAVGHKVKVTAPPIKNGSSEFSGIYHSIFGFLSSYRVSKYKEPRGIIQKKLRPREFRTSVFYRWRCYFHCAFFCLKFSLQQIAIHTYTLSLAIDLVLLYCLNIIHLSQKNTVTHLY